MSISANVVVGAYVASEYGNTEQVWSTNTNFRTLYRNHDWSSITIESQLANPKRRNGTRESTRWNTENRDCLFHPVYTPSPRHISSIISCILPAPGCQTHFPNLPRESGMTSFLWGRSVRRHHLNLLLQSVESLTTVQQRTPTFVLCCCLFAVYNMFAVRIPRDGMYLYSSSYPDLARVLPNVAGKVSSKRRSGRKRCVLPTGKTVRTSYLAYRLMMSELLYHKYSTIWSIIATPRVHS